jgi:hypothetical protein
MLLLVCSARQYTGSEAPPAWFAQVPTTLTVSAGPLHNTPPRWSGLATSYRHAFGHRGGIPDVPAGQYGDSAAVSAELELCSVQLL